MTTATAKAQRRRALRKISGAGVLRLELKDRAGNSRWVTADIIDVSEGGVGICLMTPISPGTKLTVRGNFGTEKGSTEVRVEVRYCCERSNGSFRAGLQYVESEASESARQEQANAPAQPEVLDYYEMLELSPNANAETIGRVYRILAQRYHPDNTTTGNSEIFVRLCNAHRVLIDPEQRAKYDATRSTTKKLQWKIFDQVRTTSSPDAEKRKRHGILGLLYAKTLHDPDHAS
ncbi:MAG: DnaJ domain-containing protein, partial [Acidobacteria bacterium]|nr:DnaJ domain-containing protein [Acidobacteriota bacterium]